VNNKIKKQYCVNFFFSTSKRIIILHLWDVCGWYLKDIFGRFYICGLFNICNNFDICVLHKTLLINIFIYQIRWYDKLKCTAYCYYRVSKIHVSHTDISSLDVHSLHLTPSRQSTACGHTRHVLFSNTFNFKDNFINYIN
jgi:hypothetical protein